MEMKDIIPQVLIFSTQRSGTHLLASFFEQHPQIHVRGEAFLRYERTGTITENIPGKLNMGILMYNQVLTMESLGGTLLQQKIIHLLRDPKAVAQSRLQVQADKKVLRKQYRAHYYEGETLPQGGIPDLSGLEDLARSIEQEQVKYKEVLKGVPHLELHYEDFVHPGRSISILDQDIQVRILSFLGLPKSGIPLYTKYIKPDTILRKTTKEYGS